MGDLEKGFQFLSTQMQSSYEQDCENQEAQKKTTQQISKLQEFSLSHSNIPKPIQKKINKPPIKTKRTSKRIKTITSHVNEVFGGVNKENKQSQQSILMYFSGKKRKVKEILSKLNDYKDTCPYESLSLGDTKLPYNKKEWEEILAALRKSLPKLSETTTRTLKLITDKIELENSQQPYSLWNKASKHPSSDFVPDDLKLLYNLNSEDINNEYNHSEVSDSSSEPELLEYKDIPSRQQVVSSTNFEDLAKSVDIHTVSVKSTPFKTPKKHLQQSSLSPVNFSLRNLQPFSSPISVTSIKSDSPSSDKLILSSQFSESEAFASHAGTVYATANSQFEHQYRTKVIEVSADFKVNNLVKENYQVRKIGERTKLQNDNEVQDSEDDEGDLSLIEITFFDDKSIIQVPSSPIFEPIPTSLPVKPSVIDDNKDLKQYSNKQIKEIFTKLNIKPRKSKKEMADILQRLNNIMEPVNSQQSHPQSQQDFSSIFSNLSQITQTEFTTSIHNQLQLKIQSNDYWNEKVISYEPIYLPKFKQWLDDENFMIEMDILERFCDISGICTTNQQ